MAASAIARAKAFRRRLMKVRQKSLAVFPGGHVAAELGDSPELSTETVELLLQESAICVDFMQTSSRLLTRLQDAKTPVERLQPAISLALLLKEVYLAIRLSRKLLAMPELDRKTAIAVLPEHVSDTLSRSIIGYHDE